MRTPTEAFARNLGQSVTNAVRSASSLKTRDRVRRLSLAFADHEAARTEAARLKDEILENLESYLVTFTEHARANGIQIHPAKTAEEARSIVLDLCRRNPGVIVKGKSMATEEIHLNHALEEAGFEVVETDLGEFVVQIDGDTPSHIVTPIIHKDRVQVAQSFAREGLGEYTEEPGELALQARWHLRNKFKEATVGISGVNFAIAETGRLVIVENEGNNRLSTTAPDIHVAVMGIEKLLASESDLPLFLKLLAGSATGQAITTYTHFIHGPRGPENPDGPQEVHLVLLDAGRREILNSRYRAILRCIRCGACLNVCPVYRQVSGHGYGHVYPGPIGAVLAPLLEKDSGHLRQLPKASTLCGSCEEVCPVKIPIPDMLLHLRDEAGDKGSWEPFARIASDPKQWGVAKVGARIGPAIGWDEFRMGPKPEGRKFRDWWSQREGPGIRFRLPESKSGRNALPDEVAVPTPPDLDLLWATFTEVLTALGGEVVFVKTIQEALKEVGETVVADSEFGFDATTELWTAHVGLTRADCAIAETGTLVIPAKPGRARLMSLLPPHHIAVIYRSQIVPRLEDAIQIGQGVNTVWVTGPSRTADIEGVLVRGVHGPGRVTVVVLPDP